MMKLRLIKEVKNVDFDLGFGSFEFLTSFSCFRSFLDQKCQSCNGFYAESSSGYNFLLNLVKIQVLAYFSATSFLSQP